MQMGVYGCIGSRESILQLLITGGFIVDFNASIPATYTQENAYLSSINRKPFLRS